MSKEFKKYENTRSAIESLNDYVSSELEVLKKNAPKELTEKVQDFYKFIKNYDVEKIRPKAEMVKGKFFDEKKLIQRIIRRTGYLWKVKEIKSKKALEERLLSKEDFEERYNFIVDKYKVFEFDRDTTDRSQLESLELVLFPGRALLYYSTGRVDSVTKLCDSPDQLMKEFNREFE